MKLRAFLAFDIPKDVQKNLGKIVADFREKEKAVKWVEAEKMHVTMKFFGNVKEELLLGDISSKIEEAVAGFPASNLQCEGIGVFPDWRYPRVIWAGFYGETEKVVELQKRIEGALEGFELPKDKREFRLHLTLGRTKGKMKNSQLVNLVEKLGPINFGKVAVDRLTLYKSLLTKTGPVYTPLRNFPLLCKEGMKGR